MYFQTIPKLLTCVSKQCICVGSATTVERQWNCTRSNNCRGYKLTVMGRFTDNLSNKDVSSAQELFVKCNLQGLPQPLQHYSLFAKSSL